jgi:hypothetical protein
MTTATANALPEIAVLPGETGSVTAEGTVMGENVNRLSTALSAVIKAVKVHISIVINIGGAITVTGRYESTTFEGQLCNTPGDADGVALVSAEGHFVWVRTGAEGGLALAGLFTIPGTLSLECGPLTKPTLTVKVTGSVLGLIETTSGSEVTSFKMNMKCTKPNNGKQEWKEYFNDEGKKVKGVLSANLGLGAETACEELEEPMTMVASKMLTFVF